MNPAPAEAKPEVELRQRQPSDLPALRAILAAVHAETGYPVDGPSCFDEFLSPPPDQVLHAIVAVTRPGPADNSDTDTDTNGDVVVGHAMLMSPTAGGGDGETSSLNLASRTHLEGGGTVGDHAVLSRFFVSREAQARGIGAKMLEEAVAWGRRREEEGEGEEKKRVVLVVLEKDARAVRLYDRAAGWVRVGERDVFTSRWGERYSALAYLGPDPRSE